MDIIVFGRQGSGKGTQGKILAERYSLKVFDMGAELRHMIESGTPLSQRIKDIVEKGNLVDDDTIIEIVTRFIESVGPDQPILFDGIPRTRTQAEKLQNLVKEYGRDAFALLIKISEDEAIKRLTQRRVCPNCKEVYPAFYKEEVCAECDTPLVMRQDDVDVKSVEQRLSNFQKETMPVIDNFAKIDRLIEVDGEQSIPDVTEEMIEKAGYLFD